MTRNANYYFYFSLVVLGDLATFLLARWSQITGEIVFALAAIVSFTLCGYFFMKLLPYGLTAVLSVIWIGVVASLVAIVSFFLFGESLTEWQIFGIVLVFLGLVLVETSNKSVGNKSVKSS